MAIKIEPEEVEEGEAWLGSFADMMSLLLGFFMILYSMSHMDEKKFHEFGKLISASVTKSKKTEIQNNLDVTSSDAQVKAFQMLVTMLNLGDLPDATRKIIEEYSEQQGSKGLEQLIKDSAAGAETLAKLERSQTLKFVFSSDILFAPGSTELNPSVSGELNAIAKVLVEVGKASTVEVQGHSDGQIGPNTDNLLISIRRAANVANALISSGVDKRIIKTTGFGDSRPLVPELNPDGSRNRNAQAKNRRIEIVLTRGGG